MVQENPCVSRRGPEGGRLQVFLTAPLPALRYALQPGPSVGPCRSSRVSTDPPRQVWGHRDPEKGPHAGSGGTMPCSTRESRWRAESRRFPLIPDRSPGCRIRPAAPSILSEHPGAVTGRRSSCRAGGGGGGLCWLPCTSCSPNRAGRLSPLSASQKAALCFPKSTKLPNFGMCKLLRLRF